MAYGTVERSKAVDSATDRACFSSINRVAPGAYCPAAEDAFCESDDRRAAVHAKRAWRPLTAAQVEAVGFEAAYKHSQRNPATAWLRKGANSTAT